MLRQRVITAVLMMAVLLPCLFAPMRWPFVALSLVMMAAAGWEWTRLAGKPALLPALGSGLALALACLLSDRVLPPKVGEANALWWSGVLLWTVGGALVLRGGPAAWPRWPQLARWGLGLLLLWLAWTAMVHAKDIGINFLLSVMCVVWAADIAAYFGGRAFGRRKLAPSISPGKSWEGVYSGMLGVLVLALLWIEFESRWSLGSPSLFLLLKQQHGWAGLALASVLLAGLSVVGDLFESLVKRAAGAKDSSRLLPGHGGVLDRIDALLPVLPAALALISL